MIFSDIFKIITNMNIFQHDELSKNTNLKLPPFGKSKKRKESQMSLKKKSTPEIITNGYKNEKPTEHKRMKINII